jgi:hypothetical protein
VWALPLKDRKGLLEKVVRRYGMQGSEHVLGHGKAAFRAVSGLDLEGIVAKRCGCLKPENDPREVLSNIPLRCQPCGNTNRSLHSREPERSRRLSGFRQRPS